MGYCCPPLYDTQGPRLMQTKRHLFLKNVLSRPGNLNEIGIPGVLKKTNLQPIYRFASVYVSALSWKGNVLEWLWTVGHSRTLQTYHCCLPTPARCYVPKFLGLPLNFEHLNNPGTFLKLRAMCEHQEGSVLRGSFLWHEEPINNCIFNSVQNLIWVFKRELTQPLFLLLRLTLASAVAHRQRWAFIMAVSGLLSAAILLYLEGE